MLTGERGGQEMKDPFYPDESQIFLDVDEAQAFVGLSVVRVPVFLKDGRKYFRVSDLRNAVC